MVLYINPGSLGCLMKNNSAQCGLLIVENGNVEYKNLKLSYNVQSVKKDIEEKKYPDYQAMLDIFYGGACPN